MLKQPGWTAGSKSKKVRGLNVKNWAWLEIFLHSHGLRVDTAKDQGLFRKIARRRGIFRSDPLDRDLRAQV